MSVHVYIWGILRHSLIAYMMSVSPFVLLYVWGNVRAGASSHFKAKTIMTGEDTAGNHRLLLKCIFNIEGNDRHIKELYWELKPPKYNSSILEYPLLKGGLRSLNLAQFCKAFRVSWVKRTLIKQIVLG